MNKKVQDYFDGGLFDRNIFFSDIINNSSSKICLESHSRCHILLSPSTVISTSKFGYVGVYDFSKPKKCLHKIKVSKSEVSTIAKWDESTFLLGGMDHRIWCFSISSHSNEPKKEFEVATNSSICHIAKLNDSFFCVITVKRFLLFSFSQRSFRFLYSPRSDLLFNQNARIVPSQMFKNSFYHSATSTWESRYVRSRGCGLFHIDWMNDRIICKLIPNYHYYNHYQYSKYFYSLGKAQYSLIQVLPGYPSKEKECVLLGGYGKFLAFFDLVSSECPIHIVSTALSVESLLVVEKYLFLGQKNGYLEVLRVEPTICGTKVDSKVVLKDRIDQSRSLCNLSDVTDLNLIQKFASGNEITLSISKELHVQMVTIKGLKLFGGGEKLELMDRTDLKDRVGYLIQCLDSVEDGVVSGIRIRIGSGVFLKCFKVLFL